LIKKENKLPIVDLTIASGSPPILKKGETIHFANYAMLKEMRTVNLGWESGSHGVSIRIMKGVSYRVGATRGHVIKEDRLVQTSQGVLLITNQRLFLHPIDNSKPLSIPLNKILSHHCSSNGIQFYKDGREKGYYLMMTDSASCEIAELCLGHLLRTNN